ncbi:MAG: HD domain-containing phosphohydrolase [Deltaproteobacteria bacterium]
MANNRKNKTQNEKPASGAGQKLLACKKRLNVMAIELEIYREIGGLVAKGVSRNYILSRLMDCVLKAMETDSGTLYLLDTEKNELTFEVVKGKNARKLKGLRMRADSGIAGMVVSTKKPYVSADLERDRHWLGIKTSEIQKNMLAVPLKIKDQVIGVIQVIHKKKDTRFTKADLRVLASIANHFSILMERGNLFSELDDRIKQLSILHDVGTLLISTLEHSVVRRRAIEAITRLMRAETGSLLLVDKEAGELFFEVALGEKGKALKEIRLKMGEGIAGWVAKNGKSVIVHDVAKDKRFQQTVDKKSEFKTRDMVCVPVTIKNNIIGVLQAINKVNGSFTRDDLKLFELFSHQVAIALDNARLYEEIKETFYSTSEALAAAIEKRDPYTGGHTKRVLEYSHAIARHLDIPKEMIEMVKLSAVLHDVGKIGVEDRILRKEAPLDSTEVMAMKMHPQFGAEILGHIPQLKDIVPGMLYHHERLDGLGYPSGLRDGNIPLIARIISVADTFDAMTTTRPYRRGLPSEVAFNELRKYSGTQFDAAVVAAFLKAFKSGDVNFNPEGRPQPEKAPQKNGGAGK